MAVALEQVWEYAPEPPSSLLSMLLGAYRGSGNMQLLVNILRAMRPFAAGTTHLRGARLTLCSPGIPA